MRLNSSSRYPMSVADVLVGRWGAIVTVLAFSSVRPGGPCRQRQPRRCHQTLLALVQRNDLYQTRREEPAGGPGPHNLGLTLSTVTEEVGVWRCVKRKGTS